jgi:hypothetical protein
MTDTAVSATLTTSDADSSYAGHREELRRADPILGATGKFRFRLRSAQGTAESSAQEERMVALVDVVRESESIDEIAPDQRLFAAAQIAEHLEEALADPALLIEVSQQFIRIAQSLRCDRVKGVSPVGERLAGAVVAVANNGLRVYQAQQPAEHVLVIDGVAATGAQLSAACRHATSQGVPRVSAAAVLVLSSSRKYLAEHVGSVESILPITSGGGNA